MIWNSHSSLKDQHAFLGASQYHWVNYNEEKLLEVYGNWRAKQQGTELHAIAAKLIEMGIKLPKSKKTFNLYVNDGIGFRMKTEQILYFSDNCFGTADTICFRNKLLRIHDLKTGKSQTSIKQLEIYAALFCLEYRVNPNDIDIELRIYQLDEVSVEHPDPEEILYIMNKIVVFDKKLDELKRGE